jgi:hypothetical protein
MMFRRKELSFAWFIVQILFLTGGFHFVLKVLGNKSAANGMLSENTSLEIGLSAMLWAFSMISMMIGVYQIGNKKEVKNGLAGG